MIKNSAYNLVMVSVSFSLFSMDKERDMQDYTERFNALVDAISDAHKDEKEIVEEHELTKKIEKKYSGGSSG